MALHRDIFWVGRQWAVTGFGVQAVDQRLRGILDIEIGRLWDDDFVQSRRSKPGLNLQDFDQALAVARTRYPRQGRVPRSICHWSCLSRRSRSCLRHRFHRRSFFVRKGASPGSCRSGGFGAERRCPPRFA